jgi:hypothetical protein
MDIEKTIEFLLGQQAQAEARQAHMDEALAQLAEEQRRTGLGLQRLERVMRRAIALGVQAIRAERRQREKMRSEFDEIMTQLAAAQLITEKKLQVVSDKLDRLIDALHGSSDGHPPSG